MKISKGKRVLLLENLTIFNEAYVAVMIIIIQYLHLYNALLV